MKLIFRHFLLPPVSSLSLAIWYFGNDLYSWSIRMVRAGAHWCIVPRMLSDFRLGCSVVPHSYSASLAGDFSLLLQL